MTGDMAAPQSNPDLSVVSTDEIPSTESVSSGEKKAPESPARSPEHSTGETATPPQRKGVSIWVVVAVAVIGLAAFFNQYQRAETLDARVNSLAAELEVAGENLQAYQAHLDIVRTSVGDLSERVGSLKSLVNRDPLTPPAAVTIAPGAIEGVVTPTPPAEPAPSPKATAPAEAAASSEAAALPEAAALTEVNSARGGQATGSSAPIGEGSEAAGGRETDGAIRDPALSTPFAPEAGGIGFEGDSLIDLETLLAPSESPRI